MWNKMQKFQLGQTIMNTLFKALLIMSTLGFFSLAYAREIILIENLAGPAEEKMLTRILKEKFNIPESFIKVNQKRACKLNQDAIMHLCLRADGELDVLKIETYAIENMLRTFLEMEK